jgi:hypothetical protein
MIERDNPHSERPEDTRQERPASALGVLLGLAVLLALVILCGALMN